MKFLLPALAALLFAAIMAGSFYLCLLGCVSPDPEQMRLIDAAESANVLTP